MTWCYTVRVSFSGESADDEAKRWVGWMTSKHLADVRNAGARSAQLVRMQDAPDSPPVFEARYEFDSQAAFEVYVAERAPDLRAEGLRLFPTDRGISYSRTQGEMIFAL